jgi:hypothetical protein
MRIRLYLPNRELQAIRERLWRERDESLDYGHNQLHRVFNNGRFDEGGRFYGGWWQNVPKESRKYLEINYKSTIEIDYKGLQLRMLYALERLEAPEDPYDAPGWPREIQKIGILMLLNAETRQSAVHALAAEGVSNANGLISALQDHHSQIARHFHSGVGVKLQFLDSQLAATVMSRTLLNALPVHDSFIVRLGSEDELVESMERAFTEQYPGQVASVTFKQTILDEARETTRQEGDFFNPTWDPDYLTKYSEYLS